jgi:hypothetical protein
MQMRLLRLVAALAVALLVSGVGMPRDASAQGGPILRLAADFKNFDGTESFTAVGVDPVAGTDGVPVFQKTIFVPAGTNVLYVTVSTTGDTHDGAALWLSCRVNGAACNPGFGGAGGTPGGWVNLNKHKNWIGLTGVLNGDGGGGGGDAHDNSIHYTWCTKFAGGAPARVEVRLASSGSTDETSGFAGPPNVFFEAAHFFIDASRITGNNACTQAPPVEDRPPGIPEPF